MHRIVGLDIAADSLRAAALATSFRGFTVERIATAPLPAEGTPAERLRAGIAALELTPPLSAEDSVAVALPGSQVATHLVTLPFSDPRRIEQVLPAEVESAIPFELEDVVWDFTVLSQAEGKTDVLVGIVRKTALRELLEALSAAGIDPRLVTLAPLALAALGERRQLGAWSPEGPAVGDGEPGVALLDAGPDRAELVLLHGGVPVLARSLASGSAALWAAAEADAGALARLLSGLARDLKISLRARPSRAAAPRQLLLAGTLASLPGAAEVLQRALGFDVEPAEPAAGSAATALALGLALRAQQPRGRVNFRKGEFAFQQDLSAVRDQLARVGIAAAVLLALAIGLGLARLSSLHRQEAAYDEALCAATRKVLGTCVTDSRQALGQLSGGRSKAADIPRVSASDVLAGLLARLPDDAMPTLEEVEVTTTSLRVKGVAESFGKVDDLLSALKKDRCFGAVQQPRVEKQSGGTRVNFSIEVPYSCSGEGGGA